MTCCKHNRLSRNHDSHLVFVLPNDVFQQNFQASECNLEAFQLIIYLTKQLTVLAQRGPMVRPYSCRQHIKAWESKGGEIHADNVVRLQTCPGIYWMGPWLCRSASLGAACLPVIKHGSPPSPPPTHQPIPQSQLRRFFTVICIMEWLNSISCKYDHRSSKVTFYGSVSVQRTKHV